MKLVLQLEQLALALLSAGIFFFLYPGNWGLFLGLFFVPDLSFLFFVMGKKAGAIAYNIAHHQGVLVLVIIAGYLLHNDGILKCGLIFITHSFFDRILGYGLKYLDNFDHTHLGWIGKSKNLNIK